MTASSHLPLSERGRLSPANLPVCFVYCHDHWLVFTLLEQLSSCSLTPRQIVGGGQKTGSCSRPAATLSCSNCLARQRTVLFDALKFQNSLRVSAGIGSTFRDLGFWVLLTSLTSNVRVSCLLPALWFGISELTYCVLYIIA